MVLLGLMTPLHAGDFIRQIQMVNGQTLIYDTPVTSTDGEIMARPTNDSTIFQLYSQVDIPASGGAGLFVGATVLDLGLDLSLSLFGQNASLKFVKVDEKTVGTFMPDVTVQALSEDPHVPARTRADHPYGMRIVVAGLQPAGAGVPAYASQVQVRRSYRVYDPLINAPTSATASGEYTDAFTFQQNSTFVNNGILQRLPTDTPTQAIGDETFTVYTDPAAGSPQSQFGSATVQVWPVATATITGIDPARTYQAAPTDGSLQLKNLYPKSVTYVQVYRGAPALGTSGTALPSTAISYDSAVPQNAVIPITGIDAALGQDGVYTIEVLTTTPFNGGAPERIAYTTFNLDRTIQVNATTATLED